MYRACSSRDARLGCPAGLGQQSSCRLQRPLTPAPGPLPGLGGPSWGLNLLGNLTFEPSNPMLGVGIIRRDSCVVNQFLGALNVGLRSTFPVQLPSRGGAKICG